MAEPHRALLGREFAGFTARKTVSVTDQDCVESKPMTSIDRLLVRDVMHRDVVTIDETATLGEAAAQFDKHGISGAPVVDVTGKCIGVLSVTDFAYREKDRTAATESFGLGFEHLLVKETGWPIQIEPVRDDRVRDHMSPFVRTIRQDAPILNAARVMVSEHLHRLIIVDADERPTGVLGALDVVKCIIKSAEKTSQA